MAATRTERTRSRASRRVGYAFAAVIDVALMWVNAHLLGWGWPPFLTEDFELLLPIVQLSFGASAVVNVAWFVRDPEWWRHLGQLALNVIAAVVMVRTWQIFPFDLSEGWTTVFRIMIVLGLLGVAISSVVELVGLVRSIDHPNRRHPHHPHTAAA